MKSPTKDQIYWLRSRHGLTQPEFAALVHTCRRSVQGWEAGTTRMHPGLWELAIRKLNDQREMASLIGAEA